jgi:hypothetical protein
MFRLPLSSVILLCCAAASLTDLVDASSTTIRKIERRDRRQSQVQRLLPKAKGKGHFPYNDDYGYSDEDGYNDAAYPVGDYDSISAPDVSPPGDGTTTPPPTTESDIDGRFPVGGSDPTPSPNDPVKPPTPPVAPMPSSVAPTRGPTFEPSPSRTPAPVSPTAPGSGVPTGSDPTPGSGPPTASDPTPGVDGTPEDTDEGNDSDIDESSTSPFGITPGPGTVAPSVSPDSDPASPPTNVKPPTISPMPSADGTLSLTAGKRQLQQASQSVLQQRLKIHCALQWQSTLSQQNTCKQFKNSFWL